MNQPSSSHRPADADRVAAISRLVRRVCLLREQGDPSGARELESTRLAEAVRLFREEAGANALTEEKLDAIYETERKRVADADALCELLIPRLKGSSGAVAQSRPGGGPMVTILPNREASTTVGPPGITELLDAMLAAERTGRGARQDTRPET